MTETVQLSQPSTAPRSGRDGSSTGRGGVLTDGLAIAVAIGGGLVLGAWTADAQGWLPFDLAPLANSSGSWALIAFAVALLARRATTAAVCGALTLAALVAGYYGPGDLLQGPALLSSSIVFWGVIALLAGPPLGLAAHALRHGIGLRAAMGAAVMSGVLIGEGISSLIRIFDSTSPAYWQGEIVTGVALLLAAMALRLRPPAAAAAVVGCCLVTGGMVLAYGAIPSVLSQL